MPNASTYHPQQQQYYEQTNFLPPPLMSSQTAYNGNYVPQTQNLPASSTQRWSGNVAEAQGVYHQWESSAHAPPHVSTVSNLQSGPYPPYLHPWQAPCPSYVDASSSSQAGFYRPISPSYSYSAKGGSGSDPGLSADPPRRRASPGSTRDHYSTMGGAASSRSMGVLRCSSCGSRRPIGCSSCKATQSPEWRRGPNGKKELCNA